jgi:hypothetical protein
MGIELDIYRLYRWQEGDRDRLVLAKAVRPEFPNWSQSSEDEAQRTVDARFDSLVAREAARFSASTADLIGAWEGGYPEGEVFYEAASGIEVDVWVCFDAENPGYLVFGAQSDEASFWESVRDLSQSSAVSKYPEPACQVRVLFIQ